MWTMFGGDKELTSLADSRNQEFVVPGWRHGAPFGCGVICGVGLGFEFGMIGTWPFIFLWSIGGGVTVWMAAEAFRMIRGTD